MNVMRIAVVIQFVILQMCKESVLLRLGNITKSAYPMDLNEIFSMLRIASIELLLSL